MGNFGCMTKQEKREILFEKWKQDNYKDILQKFLEIHYFEGYLREGFEEYLIEQI